MDITSKASITVGAKLTAGEIFAAVYAVPGAVEAILDVAQTGIEAAKGSPALTLASRDVVTDADGAIVAKLVYEKADQPAPVLQPGDAVPVAPAAVQPAAAPAAPLAGLEGLVLTPPA